MSANFIDAVLESIGSVTIPCETNAVFPRQYPQVRAGGTPLTQAVPHDTFLKKLSYIGLILMFASPLQRLRISGLRTRKKTAERRRAMLRCTRVELSCGRHRIRGRHPPLLRRKDLQPTINFALERHECFVASMLCSKNEALSNTALPT